MSTSPLMYSRYFIEVESILPGAFEPYCFQPIEGYKSQHKAVMMAKRNEETDIFSRKFRVTFKRGKECYFTMAYLAEQNERFKNGALSSNL